jgi:hypothetical protein
MLVKRSVTLLGLLTLLMAVSGQLIGTPTAASAKRAAPTPMRSPALPALRPYLPPKGQAATMPHDTLPVVIDGEKTPELIPDAVAARHFVIAAAQPDKPSDGDIARRRALLFTVGFSKDDQAAVIHALATVGDQLAAFEQERRQLSRGAPASRAAIMTLKQQRDAVLEGAHTRIHSTLSAEGVVRYETFLREHMKNRIKIFGDLPR